MIEANGTSPATDEAAARSRIEQRLYESRTVLVFGEIDMPLAERTSARLLALASENKRPIRVVINSPFLSYDSSFIPVLALSAQDCIFLRFLHLFDDFVGLFGF